MADYWRQQCEQGFEYYESNGIIRQGGPFGPIVGERGLEQSNILFDLITLGTGIKAVFNISKTLIMKGINKTSSTVIPRAVGAAPKGFSTVLQTGEHTLNKSTLKALGLTKEQGKIAIESLKQDLRLPPNFHGKIMGNGDLVHPQTKQALGNLFDYLP
jgi:hypothetical protein